MLKEIRIELETGYNGYVHKITNRVTYIRHALNESFAIIPTRQLVNAQIINYSKELKMVPAIVDVGVSYLNNPKQVASILVKVGKRAMKEVVDEKGKHLILQKRCPYLEDNKPTVVVIRIFMLRSIHQKFDLKTLMIHLWTLGCGFT